MGARGRTWHGPTTFGDGKTYKYHPEGDTMGYLVKVLTWELVPETPE